MTSPPETAPAAAPDDGGAWPLRWLGALSAVSLFLLVLLISADVIGRYMLNAPIRGALEVADMLMCAIIFAVLPLACARERHITIDLLDRLTPPPVARLREVAVNLIGAGFMTLVAWRMWVYGGKLMEYGDQTLFLKIPIYPANFFIAATAAVSAATLLANAWRAGRR